MTEKKSSINEGYQPDINKGFQPGQAPNIPPPPTSGPSIKPASNGSN